ncbi:DEAD/DEAH box helicase family protein [Exiguobacterium sp.]|uniref:DEAD/DEAH box helicase family protein n=1 Tax=Exiguobacterium sp. TaxID=44751 RepID=UPI0028A9708E|nr:DEAD/DEAH box helicase family protein [Exiguobacterium sp.]
MSKKVKKTIAPQLKFNKRLILNQYFLSLLSVENFEEIGKEMKDPKYEGLSEENNTNFYYFLVNEWKDKIKISPDKLLSYDNNIVEHTQRISDKRELDFSWKYFQYLALLFTEFYLDEFFNEKEKFCQTLNEFVEQFNEDKSDGNQINLYNESDLKKLAFWNATGSGKTLLMHVNILQYLHYLKVGGKENELNKIILLTPNERLSNQHLDEFKLSNLKAELFDKTEGGLLRLAETIIEIIDIHKIEDQEGDKTVAIDSFEGNNLVLVDEGHRGASGIVWKEKREKLSESGFSFEYSATFGQAMKASGKTELVQEYAKCILFDYSYRYFHSDGYGKDYQILNLQDDSDEGVRQLYLTACLLTYYQQKKLYEEKKRDFSAYLIDNPLFIFVGASVLKGKKNTEASDIIDVLTFISDFVKHERKSTEQIKRLLSGSPGLLDGKGREIFKDSFKFLVSNQSNSMVNVYKDVLRTVFNSNTSGAELHVENLKGVTGEIGIRVGENPYFGVINVGDDKKLVKLCSENGLITAEKGFSQSLFQGINVSNSTINILIGSKKFTEGWSSWRVTTMGLLNVGQSEGAEIIQLFGRGVRLKGYKFRLKRSKFIKIENPEMNIPKYIDILETLNVFGIRANYMKQFEEYLKEEDLNPDKEQEFIELPIVRNKNINISKLNTLKIKGGLDFKKQGPKPSLSNLSGMNNKIIVDWYPKIQVQSSAGSLSDFSSMYQGKLDKEHLAFVNFEEIFFELQRYKSLKSWYNLIITKQSIIELMENPDWYTLLIPKEELEFTDFKNFKKWQEISIVLLKKYCDFFYKHKKADWEFPHLSYQFLTNDDANFIKEEKYIFIVNKPEENDSLISKLNHLKELMENEQRNDIDFQNFAHSNFEPLDFGGHLYNPLIYIKKNATEIEVTPVHLNEGERNFVEDLKNYFLNNDSFFKDKELYLLRNKSKAGIGFFEANNFFPDFIMWLIHEGKQYITFIDPKGIRNLKGLNDPKIQLSQTIKGIEKNLSQQDNSIVLNSFIIAGTSFSEVSHWGDETDFEKNNIFFQYEDKHYINKLFRTILVF